MSSVCCLGKVSVWHGLQSTHHRFFSTRSMHSRTPGEGAKFEFRIRGVPMLTRVSSALFALPPLAGRSSLPVTGGVVSLIHPVRDSDPAQADWGVGYRQVSVPRTRAVEGALGKGY